MQETNLSLKHKCGMRIHPFGNATDSMITPISNHTDYDNAFIPSKKKGLNGDAKNVIKCEPMEDEWKERCKKGFWWFQDALEEMKAMHPYMKEGLYDLKNLLLSFGGEATCLDAYEEDLDKILQYGQLWLGTNVKMMKGLPSQCHRNSCDLWVENKENSRICTGYALSDDGMWRQHSWLVWMKPKSNQIVETTVPRLAYFGYVMTTEQCEKFVADNW